MPIIIRDRYDKPLITVHGQSQRANSYQAVAIFFLVRLARYRGCSSVVERMLCMYEAPGSIPGISKTCYFFDKWVGEKKS